MHTHRSFPGPGGIPRQESDVHYSDWSIGHHGDCCINHRANGSGSPWRLFLCSDWASSFKSIDIRWKDNRILSDYEINIHSWIYCVFLYKGFTFHYGASVTWNRHSRVSQVLGGSGVSGENSRSHEIISISFKLSVFQVNNGFLRWSVFSWDLWYLNV